VWGLIIDEINKVGSTSDSRRRNALLAAFRLPRRPEINEPWQSTLNGRFTQLLALPGVFGNPPPITTTPMHKAWSRAVGEKLVPMLRERLDELTVDGSGWAQYVEIARETEALLTGKRRTPTIPEDVATDRRLPSKSAQPVYLDLFVTTVFMKGRVAQRRITERLVTAREHNVGVYMARALAGETSNPTDLPVRALWGCRAKPRVSSQRGEPVLTELHFPRSLQRGEQHYFASESIEENLTKERLWINVEIDHHGIAPGRRLYGCVPISGLTIRIRFDETFLPETCWWYAEKTERERLERPPDGDPHLLTVVADTVEHTFTDECYPRENYGVSLLWPQTPMI
jgi:hypothetical protein